MITSASTPKKIAGQQRFLEAYRESLRIAVAARLAGVHRATVYRWLLDPTFAEAVEAATQDFFRRNRERAQAMEDERSRQRREREEARRSMRCEILARARAAKQK